VHRSAGPTDRTNNDLRDSEQASYPIFLRLDGRQVVMFGAGRIATRRVERLQAAGARLTVVAPEASDDIRRWAAEGRIEWRSREADITDVAGAVLVFAATDNPAINERMAATARAAGIPVQRADAADESDFLVPALIHRGPLQIAVASDGTAPTLSRRLKAQLETWIPRAYGDLAELAGAFRAEVRTRLPAAARAPFWHRVFDGPIAEKVFAGRYVDAQRDLEAELLAASETGAEGLETRVGEVYLVGGGPGDPDLLTFRALRLMQRADVVLYDSLVAPAIVDLVPSDAERIHVGKRASRHTLPQPDINTLMVDLARAGRRVLRLKGGDPFTFGRGGEEIAELAESGIPFQVVPGITAANGCAAYAGIPLTHRDYAQSVIFVTGHLKGGELKLSWQELARPGQTVVFFMGRRALSTICRELAAHGLPDDWPVAMVIDGTTSHQRLIVGSLSDMPAREAACDATGPALLIVGEVVRLHEKLGWFDPGRVAGQPISQS
jgi:uroporphyrin-III C-methyltransferase/precorrin-2 dehydrogenase/sirohydrochlorin ferrochelatase